MNKKYKKIIILSVVILLSLLVITLCYFKPIKLVGNITDDKNVDMKLSRRFNKCYVKNTIKSNKLDKEIVKELKKDGYKKDKDTYYKNTLLNKSCDVLKEEYEKERITFKLKGDNKETIEVNSDYKDDGYILKGRKRKFVKTTSIDSSKVGKEFVVHKLTGSLFNKYLIREVNIEDTTKPVITLKGNTNISLYLNDKYEEPGFTAEDNYDGDITNKVITSGSVDVRRVGKYEITYKVSDFSGNEAEEKRTINVREKTIYASSKNISVVNGLTYINGILVVNKRYGLPKTYNPGVNKEALKALKEMQADAKAVGLNLRLVSGYRSYLTQRTLYNNYVRINGEAKADTFSAKPGHSEHQTGLAFDVGSAKGSFANTAEAKWLEQNCHLYGFIIRYPKGKTNITGYIYEPWHVRYLGVSNATSVKNSGLTLEEYLGIN